MKTTMKPASMNAILYETDRKLRPDRAAVKMVHERAKALIRELKSGSAPMFEIVDRMDHGSMSRGTGIKNFRDLDQILILDPEALRTRAGTERTPRDTVNRLARTIRDRRKGLVSMGAIEVRAQAHSIGILYPRSKVRIDLVPARRDGRHLVIPEPDSDRWIQTDPVATAARTADARKTVEHALVAIRLLKGWSRARGGVLPSFAIETLVVDRILETGWVSLHDLVCDFIGQIGDSDKRCRLALGASQAGIGPVTVLDPVSRANLTVQMTWDQHGKLIDVCRATATHLDRIRELATCGKRGPAATLARRVFLGRHG